ncbi:MAG: beta-lactamase family protein [Chthoniobacterales bacterium]|nr:beta-lactamase family protein [Chthoniobacterales bacterium]
MIQFPLLDFVMNEEETIDGLFKEFSGSSAGAATLAIKEGQAVFAKAYGLANLAEKIPCSTSTNFRLASVTKQFTAMAIMILAERCKLSLDDKIAKFFLEFPDYGSEIRIRHLLTHTSGLLAYEEIMPPHTTIPLSDRDVLWILMQQDHLEFSPGKQFHYSNTGYSFLALIVEAASGQKFATFLEENIFQPLGMTNSIAYEPGISLVPNRAFGYAKRQEGFEFSDQNLTSAVLGDGGIYSSLADLYQWDQALYMEKLVCRKTLQQAFTMHAARSDFDGSGYGFGWYIGRHRGTERIWHYGSTCGFSTKIERFPQKQLTVIILTNRRDGEISDVPQKIADLYW